MSLDPWFDGQLRNNAVVFIICCVASFLAFLFCILMVNEERDKNNFHKKFPLVVVSREFEINSTEDEQYDDDCNGTIRNIREKRDAEVNSSYNRNLVNNSTNDNNIRNGLRLLFDLNNVKEIFVTCLKRRENKVRLQIWLILLAMSFYLVSHIGPQFFVYQFAQKVYRWSGETYSTWASLNNICNALTTLTIIPVFIKVFHFKDMTLALIGLCAYFGQNMFRGLILSPTGYYIAIIFGALGSVTSVGLRSYLSKIVERTELGKVFSLMSALESISTGLAPAIFTNIFRATIDTIPGICFVINGSLLIVSIFSVYCIDLYTQLPVIVN
jgi:hypothetical protein